MQFFMQVSAIFRVEAATALSHGSLGNSLWECV